MPGSPVNVKEDLKTAYQRLNELDEKSPSRDELLVILGIMSEAVNHYCDATFAKAMANVDRLAGKIPQGKLDQLRRGLQAAVEGFGGQEAEFRRLAYAAMGVMDKLDRKSAGETRSLFECAIRTERLLLSASLDAESGDIQGITRHLQELDDLVGAGTAVRGSYRMKVCLLGEGAVGKTSLIRRFVHGTYGDAYQQTIGTRISHKGLSVPAPGGKGLANVNLSVWDIMGHERLGRLMQSYLLGAQGALLVYSLVDKKSEESLRRWVEAIDRTTGRIPLVVMANKADIGEKQVKEGEMTKLARELGCEVMPTSARSGLNVELAFSTLVRKVLKKGQREA